MRGERTARETRRAVDFIGSVLRRRIFPRIGARRQGRFSTLFGDQFD